MSEGLWALIKVDVSPVRTSVRAVHTPVAFVPLLQVL